MTHNLAIKHGPTLAIRTAKLACNRPCLNGCLLRTVKLPEASEDPTIFFAAHVYCPVSL